MNQIQRPLTTEEAAEYLQVSVDTIRRYVREGRLPAGQLGRGYRIRKEDLDAFLAAGGDKKQAAQREEFESWVDLMKKSAKEE